MRRDLWAALGFFVIAIAVRLLAQRPDALWLDEANSVLIAARDLGGILDALRRDGNPPLYYFLLHGWMRLFGEGEGAVRGLSLATGSLLPPVLYLTARRFGAVASVTAATLGLLWPLHVHYSQVVRMYALVPVLSAAFIHFVLRGLDESSTAGRGADAGSRVSVLPWIAVLAFGIALIWTHHYGMFLVAATPVAWLLAGPRTKAAARRLGLVLGAILLLDLLWLPVVLAQSRSGVGDWIGAAFRWDAPVLSILLFGAGWHIPPSVQGMAARSPIAAWAAAWVAVAGIGAAVLALRDPARRWGGRALLAFLLVPLVAPWLISVVSRPIYYTGRYEIVAYPAFALLIGAGAAALVQGRAFGARGRGARTRAAAPGGASVGATGHRVVPSRVVGSRVVPIGGVPFGAGEFRVIGTGVVAFVLAVYAVFAITALSRNAARPPDRVTEQIAARLAEWTQPGDIVLTTGLGRAPIEYYLGRLAPGKVRIESYPEEVAGHLGWFDLEGARRDRARLAAEAEARVDRLRSFGGTLFLVDNAHFPELRALNEPLRRRLAEAASTHRVLIRAGADPRGEPLFEVSGYRFGGEGR